MSSKPYTDEEIAGLPAHRDDTAPFYNENKKTIDRRWKATLDQHGAAMARLAAEYAAVRFAKYQAETEALIEAAVKHAKEAQDE